MMLSGVVVTNNEVLGRVLQATKTFSPGDLVLREEPLLQGFNAMLSELIEALSPEKREQLFAMHHLRLGDRPRFLSSSSSSTARCHAVGRSAAERDSTGTASRPPAAKVGHHICAGVKAAHSCTPNCLWTSQTPCGAMSYFAAQPIAAGDPITICYSDASTAPTLERWAELAQAKDFICACPQCSGPGATRGVRCARCADGVAVPTFAPPPPRARAVPGMEAAAWRCDACGRAPDAAHLAQQLAEAQRLEARVHAIAEDTRCGRALLEGGARAAATLLRRARRALCGTHGAVLAAARKLRLLQGVLAALRRSGGAAGAANAHYEAAAAYDIMLMRLAESHPIAAAGVGDAYDALRNVVALRDPQEFVRKLSADDAQRLACCYLPLVACATGPSDDMVLAAAAILGLPPLLRCVDMQPLVCAACMRGGGSGGGSGGGGAPLAALLLCGGCGLVGYCGCECQKQHWQKCHKAVCKALAADDSGGGSK
ncbi:hypothetical protein JKP88DRAFT_328991 [Tribonema minus]|uniref:MYND-type domain-containing protein n=1 Tax=Tribonema minus TaxID=303371 RepID=A0A835YNU4_9STRA|nr:hypothetical protein JKP88DRAFT_328991 [Tribonema minus]